MKYVLPQKLADFLDLEFAINRVMVIESDYYLPKLLNLLPNADIVFCSSDFYKLEAASKKFNDITYASASFSEERLPFFSETFDVIMGDELLAENFNPQDIASGLGSFLKPTGYLLTSFSNLLFKPWTDKLIFEERSEFIVRRGYTKEDYERLMTASFYKEVYFAPLEREGGLENEIPFYAAISYRSVYPVRRIKSLFDKKTRKILSTLLHRLEFEVETEKNLKNLSVFLKDKGIFEEYLKDFIKEACYNPEKVLKLLKKGGIAENFHT